MKKRINYICLGTLGYTHEEQYELTHESIKEIKKAIGREKILIGILGHGAQEEFKKYRTVLDDNKIKYKLLQFIIHYIEAG